MSSRVSIHPKRARSGVDVWIFTSRIGHLLVHRGRYGDARKRLTAFSHEVNCFTWEVI